MRILAFDTATAATSIAISADGKIVHAETRPMSRGHAETLAPMVENALAATGLAFRAIDRIAVTRGPGSFTGVRIGLAFARGLALALDIPVIAPTTLAVLAEAMADGRSPVVAVLDTKRGTIYRQAFSADGAPLTEPEVCRPEDADRGIPPDLAIHVIGDCAGAVAEVLVRRQIVGVRSTRPDPVVLACLAARPDTSDRSPPTPLYIGQPQAVPAVHGGRLRP